MAVRELRNAATRALLLIRHGALPPNPERRFIGARDIPLIKDRLGDIERRPGDGHGKNSVSQRLVVCCFVPILTEIFLKKGLLFIFLIGYASCLF